MKNVKLFLSLAVVLGVISITPLAASWQFLTLGPNPPDGHALQWVIDLWRALVGLLQEGQLISSSRALDWSASGIGIDDFFQTMSVIFVVLGWIAAMGAQTESSAVRSSSEVREAAVAIGQVQHAMTNVLLDPRAQAVAEPLTDIARQLHAVGDALSSVNGNERN